MNPFCRSTLHSTASGDHGVHQRRAGKCATFCEQRGAGERDACSVVPVHSVLEGGGGGSAFFSTRLVSEVGALVASAFITRLSLDITIVRASVIDWLQMDPDNKPTREELKEEVLKVSKGLIGLPGFNLVSAGSDPHYVVYTWYSKTVLNT